MAKHSISASTRRPPRLLWANTYCLLDRSSGAAMSVREMLRQLVKQGYEVRILGATVFDSPKGAERLRAHWGERLAAPQRFAEIPDGELTHQLIITRQTQRVALNAVEADDWHNQYLYLLDRFKPDLVWFYGGQTLDLLIPAEARIRGIPSAFYLANGFYRNSQVWCRDIDLILTDTQATAEMYRDSLGIVATPVGKFIDPARFVAETHERKHLLFINPSWEKGVSVVIQLALLLEQRRPDITLEVVEARGDWPTFLKQISSRLGTPRERLENVRLTANTDDMHALYARARVLLAPSLWWESGARVLAEAMLNGIPAIVSNRGGSPGLIEDGGVVLDFPEACYEPPYQHLLSEDELEPLYQAVIAYFDDEARYEEASERAFRVGRDRHHIDVSTRRLTQAFAPLINQRAGDKDFLRAQRQQHKHKLTGRAAKPDFSRGRSVVPAAETTVATAHGKVHLRRTESTAPAAPEPIPTTPASPAHPPARPSAHPAAVAQATGPTGPAPTGPAPDPATATATQANFDWQLQGRVVVLDNRAKLLRSGAWDRLRETDAFSLVAFDPASEVPHPEHFQDSEHVQVFQHALLGDGQPATLHACLDPALSSTLKPLPDDQLPAHQRQGARVLTTLPISTISLDSIEGLGNLDWLILDDLSDAIAILEHGETQLQQTLLIQARVAFQPTHERQPSLAELQHWMARHGFRFYRFNDARYHSLFPQDTEASQQLASELQSLETLFIPSDDRLAAFDDSRKQKLVFLLHSVFNAHDLAYQVMSQVNALLAKQYLRFVEGQVGAIAAPNSVAADAPSIQAPAISAQAAQSPAQPPIDTKAAVETSAAQKTQHEQSAKSQGKKTLTPDDLIARSLPEGSLQQPGSIRWLIEKEKQFGGIHHGVVRSKTSRLDPRKPAQYSAGFVKQGDKILPTHIGGDRMSLNHHGYSIAYSAFLRPLVEQRGNERLVIAEVGILRGMGLAIWCDLFPNARVIGFDLDTGIFNGHRPVLEEQGAFQQNAPEVHTLDQFADNRKKVKDILGGDKIDVLIDDGAHTYEAITKTFKSFKQSLADDYIFFIEDFPSLETTFKAIVPGKRILYRDEMTIIAPDSDQYPKQIPSRQEFLEQQAKALQAQSGSQRPVKKTLLTREEALASLSGPTLKDFGVELKPLKIRSTREVIKKRDELYETSRKTLTRLLNDYHGAKYSERFWEILLHYFYYLFLRHYLSRWNNGVLNEQPDWSQIFARFPTRDLYSGLRVQAIIGSDSPLIGENIALPESVAAFAAMEEKQSLPKNREHYNKLFSYFEAKKKSSNQYGIDIGSHAPEYWQAEWAKDGVEIIRLPPFLSDSHKPIDWEFRRQIANLDIESPIGEFKSFWSSVALCLPCEYVEDFPRLRDMAKQLLVGKQPEVVISTLMGQASPRMLAALLTEQGIPLHLQQHGGGYGERPSHLATRIETRISDIFYTWGWQDETGKTRPGPPHRFDGLKQEYDRLEQSKDEILVLGPHQPLIPTETDKTDYNYNSIEKTIQELSQLDKESKQRLVYRFRRQHGYSQEKEREVIDALPAEVRYDFQHRSLAEAYARAREVIIVAPFTTSQWECEFLGIPYKTINEPSSAFMEIPCCIPEHYET